MFGFLKRKSKAPTVYKRADHCVSRKNIDPDALKVLYRLSNLGYTAYLVGGGVRDLLMGRKPKDFDVGTSAKPNEVKRAFRNCFLIGRRFRLAHVRFGLVKLFISARALRFHRVRYFDAKGFSFQFLVVYIDIDLFSQIGRGKGGQKGQ